MEFVHFNIYQMKNYFILISISILSSISLIGQEGSIGGWIDYSPYSSVFTVAEGGGVVYGATEFGLIEFNKSDNSFLRFSKVEGLSDVGISCLGYNAITESFFVGYANGKIDLITSSNIISNGDLFRKTISGNKSLNNVFMYKHYAYVATGFGIVKFDLEREEFSDTYIIGDNGSNLKVNDITILNDTIYAATEKGIKKAFLMDPEIGFYEAWDWVLDIQNPGSEFDIIESFGSILYVNMPGSVDNSDSLFIRDINQPWQLVSELLGYENHSVAVYENYVLICHGGQVSSYDEHWVEVNRIFNYGEGNFVSSNDAFLSPDSTIWIGDNSNALVKNPRPFHFEIINPSSPNSSGVYGISIRNNEVWVAAGGAKKNGSNLHNNDGVFWRGSDLKWSAINKFNDTVLTDVFDFLTIAFHPFNKELIYAGSLGGGLIEFTDHQTSTIFNMENSPLKPDNITKKEVAITGLDFDSDGNLWIANSKNTHVLAVYTNEKEWVSFNFSNLVNDDITGDILVASNGYKWVNLPGEKGILVFDNGTTINDLTDDQSRLLNNGAGSGGLPTNSVFCMAEDRDGEIWVGTSEGVAVFYSPGSVFNSEVNFDAQQIIVDAEGYFQYLLGSETVTAIAVDGANRKWFGTEGSGVFLMSADGTQELLHFTSYNSPLLSNIIKTIEINHSTGEVLFGTDKGIIAYKGTATGDEVTTNQTYAYPNPVPENYEGLIAIKGLAVNSDVRITDVAGNLVFSSVSEGTQVVWDGMDMNGQRVGSGVYLVFGIDSDGQDSQVAKILFSR